MQNRLILPLLAAVLLSGCAGGDLAARNERNLTRLGVNMDRGHVHSIMRTAPHEPGATGDQDGRHPYRTETYTTDGRTWEVLYFQTERTEAGEAVENENLTPVVLLDGLVVGWGWEFWQDTAAKNGITIQNR